MEGERCYQMIDGLNEERLVIAAECIGLGEAAIEAGTEYAADQEAFGRPIGHPLRPAVIP